MTEYNQEPLLDIIRTHINQHFPNKTDEEIFKGISEDKQKHFLVYECVCALAFEMYLWTQLPDDVLNSVNAIRNKHINNIRDMGIDCAKLDLSQVLQAKYYGENTRINWRCASTFYAYSDVLNIGRNGRIISHIENTKIDDSVLMMKNKLDFEIVGEENILTTIKYIRENHNEKQDYIVDFEELKEDNEEIDEENETEEDESDDDENELEEIKLNHELRDYQVECLEEIEEFLENGEDNIFRACLACGLGKSLIIAAAALKYKEDGKILILVPSKLLLYQMKSEFNCPVSLVGDGHNNQNNDIIICTFASMHLLREEFYMVIVDEAHHVENDNMWSKKLDQIETTYKILFSATINNADFTRDFEFGIQNNYLEDYCLNIPVFNEDAEYKTQITELINIHYEWTHILAYCNSLEEARKFNEILNNLNIKSEYFDGTTSMNVRNSIIASFINSEIRVICTVNTLGEGVNIRIANTAIFVEPRNSTVNVIQILGRILRKHESKMIANVVLPSYNEERDLNKFLNIISNYDERLKNSRAKINILRELVDKPNDNENVNINHEILYMNIYENVGKMLISNWENSYNELIRFINENNRFPKKSEKLLYSWVQSQKYLHSKNILTPEKITILTNIKNWCWIKNINDIWIMNYNNLKEFINKNNRLPKNKENNLHRWIQFQKVKYSINKLENDRKLKLSELKHWEWSFIDKNQVWNDYYNILLKFINENGRTPRRLEPAGSWCHSQIVLYKRKILQQDKFNILNNTTHWSWSPTDDLWENNFNNLKKFIIENQKMPASGSLFHWRYDQIKLYKKNKLPSERLTRLESLSLWKWRR
jgi:superfamily II DNA or RNA helicase